ncbi:MAG: nuclear transport factor 2 family protein [Elainella sp.]
MVQLEAGRIEATIQRYFAATGSASPVEGMVACFAPDATSQDPVTGPVLTGHGELSQGLQALVSLFDHVELTADFVAITGEAAAVKWSGRGVGHNGREVAFAGIDLFEFNPGGQIQRLRGYWNPEPLIALLQAGL